MQRLRLLAGLIVDYVRTSGYRVPLVFVLGLISGLVQGVGLVAIIPVLSLAGIGEEVESPISETMEKLAGNLGIPFSLGMLLLLFIALVVLKSGLQFWVSQLNIRVSQQHAKVLKMKLHAGILRADWNYLCHLNASDLLFSSQRDVNRVVAIVQQSLRAVGVSFSLAAYLFASFYLSFEITLLALVSAVVVLLVLFPQIKRAFRKGAEVRSSSRSEFGKLHDQLSGVRLTKVYGNTKEILLEHDQTQENIISSVMGSSRVNQISQLILSVSSATLLAGIVYMGLHVYELGVPVMLLLIAIFSRLFPLVTSLQNQMQVIFSNIPFYDAYVELMRDLDSHRESDISNMQPVDFQTRISLEKICYSYEDDRDFELNDISLRIRKHTITALLGQSGAGKSTLVDVLIGLLIPDRGTLEVDGVPIGDHNRISWRRSIAIASQESLLLDRSIRENLKFANPDISSEEIWEILEWVNAREFVRELPGQLETKAGPSGFHFSGGERQRLCIAQALTRKPAFLVLDEPTNNLDEKSRNRLFETLRGLRSKTTILIVGHDPEFESIADQVVRLEHGRMVVLNSHSPEPHPNDLKN